MPKEKRWHDMTDNELIAELEQARREEAIRLGIDPAESIKSMWTAFRTDDRFCEQERQNAKS